MEGDNMNVLLSCTGHKLQLIQMLAGQLCPIFSLSVSVGILLETGTVRAKYGFGALYVVSSRSHLR